MAANGLKESQAELAKKEKEIEQEKKSNADKEAKLTGQVEKLQMQIKDSDAQLKAMDQELKDAKKMRATLEKTVQKVAPSKADSISDLPDVGGDGEEDEPFFAAPKGARKAKKATAKKVAAKKAPKGTPKAKAVKGATAKAKKAVKGATDDWSTLTQSTLERKTVKDLREYLESKVRRNRYYETALVWQLIGWSFSRTVLYLTL